MYSLKVALRAESEARIRMQSEDVLQDILAHKFEVEGRQLTSHRWKVINMIGALEAAGSILERSLAFSLLNENEGVGGFYRDVGNDAAHPVYDRHLLQDALEHGADPRAPGQQASPEHAGGRREWQTDGG